MKLFIDACRNVSTLHVTKDDIQDMIKQLTDFAADIDEFGDKAIFSSNIYCKHAEDDGTYIQSRLEFECHPQEEYDEIE